MHEWEWFIGGEKRELKLTTQPEPMNYLRTLNWLGRQAAPSLLAGMEIDKANGTNFIGDMLTGTQLKEKQLTLIRQQTTPISELIIPPETLAS